MSELYQSDIHLYEAATFLSQKREYSSILRRNSWLPMVKISQSD